MFVNCKLVLTFNRDILGFSTLLSNNQSGSNIVLNTKSKIFPSFLPLLEDWLINIPFSLKWGTDLLEGLMQILVYFFEADFNAFCKETQLTSA
jgi:hypothetical protein